MIFYFTGTGNSLYIAKQLESDPVSIPQIMREQKKEFTADRIGIVAPVYGHEMPPMVKQFLKETIFHTDYFYLILTYGNRHGGAAELAYKYCEECGIAVNYINMIVMVDNWLPAFDMNEQKKADKKIPEQLAPILKDIAAYKNQIAAVTEQDRMAHQQFLNATSKMPADAWQHLIKVTEKCVGCGICEQVCPSGSMRIENGKAVPKTGNCQTCLACVHACPQKAIQLTIPEKNPDARYRNEHVSLQEIIAANCQINREHERR